MRLQMAQQMIITLLLVALTAAVSSAADNNLTVEEVTRDNSVSLVCNSKNCLEATVTITAVLENMISSVPLPLTVDTGGQTHFTLATFTVRDQGQPYSYSWKGSWKVGKRLADSHTLLAFAYSLPYRSGSHMVIQAAKGRYTHLIGSEEEEAIDIAMPVGTAISAARGGTVVAIRTDSLVGGPDPRFRFDGNYLVIRHADGTFGEYLHLMKNGVLVHLGDTVVINQIVALSGNTGFTTEPHLHFMVFYNIDGSARKSVPLVFASPAGQFRPTEGVAYQQ